jgi:hypothetical protein
VVSTSAIIAKRRMPWPFPHELVAVEDSFTAFFSQPFLVADRPMDWQTARPPC